MIFLRPVNQEGGGERQTDERIDGQVHRQRSGQNISTNVDR